MSESKVRRFPLKKDGGYCEKCGAPSFGKRNGRRLGYVYTLSPLISNNRSYRVCMNCILLLEAWLEHRTEGRLRMKKAPVEPQMTLMTK